MKEILTEAFIVGLVMLVIFMALKLVIQDVRIAVFMTGVVGHFLFEFFGANKWYCKYGRACQKP
jgi:hypothetical protein